MKMLSYKQDQKDKFETIVRGLFYYLVTDFFFKITKVKRISYGTYIQYEKEKVVVSIIYAPIDGGIFVEIENNQTSSRFDLNDIILVQNPDYRFLNIKLKELLEDESNVEKSLKESAKALKKYGGKMLLGDFSMAGKILKIQKDRLKDIRRFAL